MLAMPNFGAACLRGRLLGKVIHKLSTKQCEFSAKLSTQTICDITPDIDLLLPIIRLILCDGFDFGADTHIFTPPNTTTTSRNIT